MGETNFLRIMCPRCNNEQVTFGKASTWVKCNACNKLLIKPKGGKAKLRARVTRVIRRVEEKAV